MADSDNSAQRVALYVVNPREAVSEALDRIAAALPGATVGRPDDVGIVEISLEAVSFDDALTQVWDAIAAAGADDALAFAEHPDLPEHWREQARGPGS
ncbi:hypothetical protein Q5424_12975 [Conexibacter sp. JD483]|uniref:hypothetical protein n=1 Tax=unclassified Conexibacter TaxID=2627773 RepID=UPI00271937B7|nr:MULTISPECIES: hypothetical protein [unclassified Conexibacter]MDO8187342.1 hypothetical protein [Conexibacter sp. CPCC 205706]MDO8200525.1 hypothetical protein [Conexibacter sp. CPCC 205762]MDR9370006.1 hypothetical protein [Conexibacter sp. JD483]